MIRLTTQFGKNRPHLGDRSPPQSPAAQKSE
jgi:hypothetical protein